MEFEDFLSSVSKDEPPQKISGVLLALWWDKKENWESAHNTAQEIHNADGAWVHAYLHRREGDDFNAGYWYNRAKKQKCHKSLEEEWEEIVKDLLNR